MRLFKKFDRIHLAALLLATLMAAVCLVFWLNLIQSQNHLRAATIANAEQQALKIASALSQQAEAQANGLDQILRHLCSEYEGNTNPEQFGREIAKLDLSMDVTVQVAVIGADGYLVYSSLPKADKVYLGEREHFRFFRDHPARDQLYISKPVLGKVSHRWTVQFTRPLHRNGAFAGVMVLSVAARHLVLQLADLGLAPRDVAGLIGSDGFYRARSSQMDEVMGRQVTMNVPFLQPGAPARGVFLWTSCTDHVTRIYAWRYLNHYPLLVAVGLDREQFMAPAEAAIEAGTRRSMVATAIALLLCGGIVALLLQLGRQQHQVEVSEQLYHGLFEAVAEGLLVINAKKEIVAWNHGLLSICGIDEKRLKAQQFQFLTSEGKLLPRALYPTDRALRGERFDHLVLGVESDGEIRWLAASGRPLIQPGEVQPYEAVVSFFDVTAVVESEQNLRLSQSVFDAASEGIMVTDANNRIVAVNSAFTTITGYTADEAIGSPPSLLASGLHQQDFYAELWLRLLREGHWEGEIKNRRKDGQIYVERLKISVVNDDAGLPRRFVALMSDITEQKQQQEEVWHQANFDGLTGLPNRKLLEDRLQLAMAQAQRKEVGVGVLYLDLDRFKPVNDLYGHAAGDDLLCQVARRLESLLRAEDTVARVGGDEFVVLLPDLHESAAAEVASDKIVQALSQPFRIGEHIAEVSCSVGVAIYPHDGHVAADLIQHADLAMYKAKQSGRSPSLR